MGQLTRRHSTLFIALAGILSAAGGLALRDQVEGGLLIAVTAAVLIMGLPHGALDLFIARRAGLWTDWRSFVGFHAAYLVIAALTVALFIVAPVLALGAFLLSSAWHFSDDWPRLPRPVRLVAAGLIVLVPVLSDPVGVSAIFRDITSVDAALPASVPYPFLLPTFWLAAGALVVALRYDLRSAIEISVLVLMALVLPALLFFAAYFALLHSPRHLIRHGWAITGSSSRLILVGYTLVSVLIVFALIMVLPSAHNVIDEHIVRGLFIGLAALTVPHMVLLEIEKER